MAKTVYMRENLSKNEQSKPQDKRSQFFYLSRGLALSGVITGYILGPMAILGGIGFFLDRQFHTGKVLLGISLILSFILSNWIVYSRASQLAKRFHL